MKKVRLYLILLTLLIILAIGISMYNSSSGSQFQMISVENLEMRMEQKKDSIIFCTQEICGGCKEVEKSLLEVTREGKYKVYMISIDLPNVKELLNQYGLNQVPAVIKISEGQVNIYKGNLSKANLEKIVASEYMLYDRANGVEDISYSEFVSKVNNNIDFFVYFGSENCSDCKDFDKVFNDYITENPNLGIYYVDLGNLRNRLSESEYKSILEENYIQWIPLVVHLKNGIEVARYEYPKSIYRDNKDNGAVESQSSKDFLTWMECELKQ